jgi:hypothetical protein
MSWLHLGSPSQERWRCCGWRDPALNTEASEWPCREGTSLVTANNRNERNSHRRATISDVRTSADRRPIGNGLS